MKFVATFLLIQVFCFAAFAFSPAKHEFTSAGATLTNVIEGTVFDPNRRPVPDLWVELENEFNISYGRVRTSPNGRFSFTGVRSGRYVIQVYTTGTSFEPQAATVEIINIVQNSSDTVYQDINLRYKKGMGETGIRQMNGTVYAQDVPAEARTLYKQGVRELGADPAKGREKLDQAIKIFPDYYEALNALGCNYVETKEYQKSFPYLIRAITVNQHSFSSFYSLGYAAFKVNQLPEAREAARASTILEPNSTNAQLLYGTVLRMAGDAASALAVLLKAEKLSKDAPLPEVHWQLGMTYMKLNRNKEAADQLETFLSIAPNGNNKKQVQELIQKLRSNAKAA